LEKTRTRQLMTCFEGNPSRFPPYPQAGQATHDGVPRRHCLCCSDLHHRPPELGLRRPWCCPFLQVRAMTARWKGLEVGAVNVDRYRPRYCGHGRFRAEAELVTWVDDILGRLPRPVVDHFVRHGATRAGHCGVIITKTWLQQTGHGAVICSSRGQMTWRCLRKALECWSIPRREYLFIHTHPRRWLSPELSPKT